LRRGRHGRPSRWCVWTGPKLGFMDHGGVLSTAGGLVVQGGLDGWLRLYDDRTGALLHELDVGTAMIAAPMTYSVAGVQYIAITAGSGGGGWSVWSPDNVAYTRGNANRVLAFRLGGGVTPKPALLPPPGPPPEPPEATGTREDIAAGATLFATNCGHCHANALRGPVPDLRRSAFLRDAAAFQAVVRGGLLQQRGMPRWDDLLTETETEHIRAWLISEARAGKAAAARLEVH